MEITVSDIRLKKGTGVPSSLNPAEPAFGDDTTYYLGAADGTPVPFDCRATIAATYTPLAAQYLDGGIYGAVGADYIGALVAGLTPAAIEGGTY